MDRQGIPSSVDELRMMMNRLSNWGRWGDEDERGTLNFIGAEQVISATRLPQRGKVMSLAVPFNDEGPQRGGLGRTNPVHVMMQDGGDVASGAQADLLMQYTDDAVYMVLQCGTQWDALSHFFFDDKMYNGFMTDQVTSRGAHRNGIEKVADSFVARGVLLDLPTYMGVEWLSPATPIHASDLATCADRQGVGINSGDILLIRTGQIARVRSEGEWGDYAGGPAPGLSMSCAPLLHQWQVAAVAMDTWTIEVWPTELPGVHAVMHDLLIVAMGMTLGEIFDMEELSKDCQEDGIYEFLFCAPPLPITGAVGSPINPVAIK